VLFLQDENWDECLVILCNVFKYVFGFELDMRIGKLLLAWKAGEFDALPAGLDADTGTELSRFSRLKQALFR
jgi:hypothetical protein